MYISRATANLALQDFHHFHFHSVFGERLSKNSPICVEHVTLFTSNHDPTHQRVGHVSDDG